MLGAWCLVFGAWFLVLSAWCLVLGAWFLVFGAWCLVECGTQASDTGFIRFAQVRAPYPRLSDIPETITIDRVLQCMNTI